MFLETALSPFPCFPCGPASNKRSSPCHSLNHSFSCYSSFTPASESSLLLMAHVIRLKIQDNLQIVKSITFVESPNSLLPHRVTESQNSGIRAWTYWGGGAFCLLEEAKVRGCLWAPFLNNHKITSATHPFLQPNPL